MENCSIDDTFDVIAARLKGQKTVHGLGRIATTTASFLFPPQKRPYRVVRKRIHDAASASEPNLPLAHPEIGKVLSQIDDVLAHYQPKVDLSLDTAQQTMLVNALYQFSDRNGVARYTKTPHERVQLLHDKITADGLHRPATVDRQLVLALEGAPSLPSAVWDLFLTTRQLARWRDTDSIDSAPVVDNDSAVATILNWERSLAGYKLPDADGYQDAAGDAYYVWTHALARLVFSSPVADDGRLTRFYRTMFEHGSKIMSASHHLGKLSIFGTMSNHSIAGEYGNAIGDRLVSYARTVSPRAKN